MILNIRFLRLFGICCLVLGAFLLGGCGERMESTKYYYNPTWTTNGNIVAIVGLQSTRKDWLGQSLGSTYTESLKTLTAAGTGETFIYDVTGAPPYYMSVSPSRNYVGYMDGLNNGSFSKVILHNLSLEAYSGATRVELLFDPRLISFDWSSNGNRLVYCTTNEVRIRDWNDFIGSTDTLVIAQNGLEFIAWKYGNMIAFTYTDTSGNHLSLIYPDGSGRLDLAVAASVTKPSINPANTFEVYGLAGGSYCLVTYNAASPATTEVKANCRANTPRLDPTGAKALYNKVGEQSGLYTLDLTSQIETEVIK